jgi:hypothetical protein
MTQAGEPIEDNTIVEFNFDLTEKVWKPMRVRTDKTERLSATKCGLQGRRTTGERRSSMEEHPVSVTTEMLIGRNRCLSIYLLPAMRTSSRNSTGRRLPGNK